MLDYLKAENAYFEAAMEPHEALVETLFQEMGAASRRTTARSRCRTATGSTGGRSSPARNIATGTASPLAGGERSADLRRECRGRGQGIFPPRRLRGQPRRQAARDPGRRRRLGAVQAASSATSPPARTSRPSPRSASATRCGPATARASSSPRSTTSGAATAPATTARRRPGRGGDALRGERGHRLLGRRRPRRPTTA